jgi:NADH-quinone oxidoreductase subunit M
MTDWNLTLCVFLPTAAALLLLPLPRNAPPWIFRGVALAALAGSLVFAVITAVLAAPQLARPDGAVPPVAWRDLPTLDPADRDHIHAAAADRYARGFAAEADADWIPAFHIRYHVGVDGIGLPLLVLTAAVSLLAMIAGCGVRDGAKGFAVLFLLLTTGTLGCFVALDFFLFYVFFEMMLLPMYFLIGLWGGPRRDYAALKFFLYTLAGSVLILVAMIGFALNAGDPTAAFDLTRLPAEAGRWSIAFQGSMFVLLLVGFAVKLPLFPFHTWLPDAHVEAPTAVSMVLAGVLLKMGGYGLYRIAYPLCPAAASADAVITILALMGVLNIVYGALAALAQTDLKRMVAYSSISHMGFVLLGLAAVTPMGLTGGLYQMIGHGVTSAAMFFAVGMPAHRFGHREIARFGGLANTMPTHTGLAMVAFFAAMGLPGLCGFPGEALSLLGAFPVRPTLTCVAVTGVVLSACYILWMVRRVYLGRPAGEPEPDEASDHAGDHAGAHADDHHAAAPPPGFDTRHDGRPWENAVLAVFAAAAVVLGVFPGPLAEMFDARSADIIDLVLPWAGR